MATAETRSLRERFEAAALAPWRAFRWAYLPPMMVYFAYGALGLTAITTQFWVKRELTLTPSELAALAVWLGLPSVMKMVFGELVDTRPIAGSQRRAYIFIGAGMVVVSLLLLAGAASGVLTFAHRNKLYVAAALLQMVGVILQDVVADAMTTEVVPRTNADGSPRSKTEIDADLTMVQVLGRIVLIGGSLAVAWLSGYLASVMSPAKVYLLGLIIPAISVAGAMLVKTDTSERRETDWRILGGGLAFGLTALLLGGFDVPFGQEITFAVSLGVIATMLYHVTRPLDPVIRERIFYAALIIFAFRATPNVGEGFRFMLMDRYGFDERFFGSLQTVGMLLTLVTAWFLSDLIARQRMTSVLLGLTVLGTVLAIPTLILAFEGAMTGVTRVTGITPRGLAIADSAMASPLTNLGMIPLLALIAINAPAGSRALWFSLMASFMNLALTAGDLLTRYMNMFFPVDRGQYAALQALTVWVVLLGLLIPLAALMAFRRKVD